jgi:hypothetical protein
MVLVLKFLLFEENNDVFTINSLIFDFLIQNFNFSQLYQILKVKYIIFDFGQYLYINILK